MRLVEITTVSLHPQADLVPSMSESQREHFLADIRERGIKVPIELMAGKTIVDGRNRYLAAKELGLTHVPVIDAPLDGEDPILYMLRAATKRRHLTEDQLACLALEEMEQLARLSRAERARAGGLAGGRGRAKVSSADTSTAELTRDRSSDARPAAAVRYGVSERRIRNAQHLKAKDPDLYKQVQSGEQRLAVAKRAAERQARQEQLAEQATSVDNRSSDQWEIRVGDCIAEMRKLDDKCARLIFCDPPYNIGIDYGDGEKMDRLTDEAYMAWCREWIGECVRLLTNDGSLWIVINDEYADYFGIALRDAGLTRRSWIKWYETFGVNCTRNFNRCSRHIFYAVKNPKDFAFNDEAVRRASARQQRYNDKRADPSGKIWDNVWCIPRLVENSHERIPQFPTQLPLALVQPIVECASHPKDLVIDAFSGSGTTGVACIRGNRQFIGIERNSMFAEASINRLRATSA